MRATHTKKDIEQARRINAARASLERQPRHIRQWVRKQLDDANMKTKRRRMRMALSKRYQIMGAWHSFPVDDRGMYILPTLPEGEGDQQKAPGEG